MEQSVLVGIIMGSKSDYEKMKDAAEVMDEFGIPYEIKVVSAHRTPDRMFDYARTARSRGLKVIIAGAGGAAHLPGMVASLTTLPVIGVPVQLKNSTGLLAVRILSLDNEGIAEQYEQYVESMKNSVPFDL